MRILVGAVLAGVLLVGSASSTPNRRKRYDKPHGSTNESLTKTKKMTTAHFNELVSDKEVLEALAVEAKRVLDANPQVTKKNQITVGQLIDGGLLYMRLRHQPDQLIEQSLYFGRDFMSKVMSGHKKNDIKRANGEPIGKGE